MKGSSPFSLIAHATKLFFPIPFFFAIAGKITSLLFPVGFLLNLGVFFFFFLFSRIYWMCGGLFLFAPRPSGRLAGAFFFFLFTSWMARAPLFLPAEERVPSPPARIFFWSMAASQAPPHRWSLFPFFLTMETFFFFDLQFWGRVDFSLAKKRSFFFS